MKFIKSYKFILFLTFLFIFSSLFSVLYIDQRKLPNENWSKEIKLETYSINNRYDSFKTDDNSLIKLNNNFYLIYFSENSYYLTKYDDHFRLVDKYTINKSYDLIDHINTEVIDDKIHIHFTTNEKLMSLIINSEGEILSEKILDNQVIDVKYAENNIAYLKEDGIYMNNSLIYKSENIEDFTLNSINNNFIIPFVEYNLSSYNYDLKLIEYSNKIVNEKTIKKLSLDNVTQIFNIDFSIANNKNHLVVITHNKKENIFTNHNFNINNNYSIINETLNYSSGYNFNFIDNNSSYLQNKMTSIGRIDISTKGSKYPNIALFKSNGEIKPLTKTKLFPNKVNYYTYENENYITFIQNSDDKEVSIYLTSTDDKIIEKSQQLKFNDIKQLFFNTLTTFLPLFLFGQIYSLLFLVPIFVIILPFSLFKITWAEQNQDKLLIASIALFLLAKSKYVLFDMTAKGLPIIFSQPFMRLLIALVLSSISIYSMIDISKNTDNHYFRNFIIFFIIDMITFTLFFTPYFLL